MRRQYQSPSGGSERGWINAALIKVRSAIGLVLPEVLTILLADDRRAISMPGGPLELGWALLAEIECKTDETPAAADVEDCVLSILRSCDHDGSFPATEGGPPDKGATCFLRAVLRLAKSQLSHELSPEVHQSLESRFSQPLPAERRTLKSLYSNAGVLLGDFKLNGRRRWLAFPFYAAFGDLFSRHWTFAWLHSRVAEASRVVIPCSAAWMDAAADKAFAVGLMRKLLRTIRLSRIDRRRASLAERIIWLQSPNGSWSWTTIGTSVALVALRQLGVAPESAPIRKGIDYLRQLRELRDGGIVRQAWAGGGVWHLTIAADAALASLGKPTGEIEKIASYLQARQLRTGIAEFDSDVGRGDYDTTAVVLAFLARLHKKKEASNSLIETMIEASLDALLAGQSSGGGWAFTQSRTAKRAGRKPHGELRSLIFDWPSPEITARVLLGMAAARQLFFIDIATVDAIDAAIARALDYLKSAQRKDGAWWGRWSDGDVSATSEVLVALCAIDLDPSADTIARGRQWLFEAVRRIEALHAVETSWAAAALLASCPSSSVYQDACADQEFLQLIERAVDVDQIMTKLRFAYPVVYPNERYAAPASDAARALFALALLRTILQRGIANARREILWGHVPAKRSSTGAKREVELAKIFQTIRARALWLGGNPSDIGQRVVTHFSIYHDSRRNFTFPLLALHGAGWAHGYFRIFDSLLSPYATVRHPFSSRRRDELMTRMQRAMDGFKLANRRVLADTFANYYFSRDYGREPGAERILTPKLLSQLNALHDVVRRGDVLSPTAKAKLYSDSFQWEQANSVWPMVERTIRDIKDPLVAFIAFKPIVKFAFFPRLHFLIFSDFTKTDERVSEGWKAYRIAERVGWAQTERAMGKYRFLPVDLTARCSLLIQRASDLADPSRPDDEEIVMPPTDT